METDLNKHTVKELKAMLDDKGIEGKGNKKELVELVKAAMEEDRSGSNDGICQEGMLREIELLRKEKELLKRENNLLKRENQIRTGTNIVQIAEMLNIFNGGNFLVWSAQVRNIEKAYNISEEEMKILIIGKLRGKALEWFHSKAGNITLNYNELLNDFFSTKESILKQKRKFEERRWQVEEEFTTYLQQKIILSNQLAISEDELIEYVIEGITNIQLKTQAMMMKYKSIDELSDAFKDIKLKDFVKKIGGMSGEDKGINHSGEKTCFNCNKSGHISRQCGQRIGSFGSCFTCGAADHKRKDCPKTTTSIKQRRVTQENGKDCNMIREIKVSDAYNNVKVLIENNSNSFSWISCNALIDTGSSVNLIKSKFVQQDKIKQFEINKKYYGINNIELVPMGALEVLIEFNKEIFKINLLVVSNETMASDVLIGRNFLSDINAILNFDQTYIKDKESIMNIEIEHREENEIYIDKKLNKDKKDKVVELIEKYEKKELKTERTKVEYNMKIRLDREDYFFCSPRRLAYSEKEKLLEILQDLQNKGIIRHSTSPYCSPIVLVKKKNSKELRLCVDYRTLNKHTRRENYPLPVIEDLIDKLSEKKYFTSLDLKSGFHQVDMSPESIQYTSFITPFGQFEYSKMPFGCPRANGQVERVNRVLAPMISKLISGENEKQWDQILSEVEFAINNTINKSTNETPSVLLFGVNQRGKIVDRIGEYLANYVTKDDESQYSLTEIRTVASEKMEKTQLYNEKKFNDKRKKPKKYKGNDLVMITNVDTTVGINKKLIPKYRGPYIIKKVIGHDRYLVEDVPGFQLTQKPMSNIYEVSRLKPWFFQTNKEN